MSYFGEADLGSSFQPFAAFRQQLGFVPKLFLAQTLLPRAIEAEAALTSRILFTDKALTRVQKECILLLLAAARGNSYCFSLHYQTLRLLGVPESRLDRIVAGYQSADLAPANAALLRIILTLATLDSSITPDDIKEASSHGLTDESLLEAMLTAALGRLLCTLSTGVGAVPDFAPRAIPPFVEAGSVSGGCGRTGFSLQAPELAPDVFAPFVFLHQQFGSIPPVFLAQTLRPDVLEVQIYAIRSLLVPESPLNRVQRERVLLAGHAAANPTPSDRALLEFARKLSTAAAEFSIRDVQALREHGFAEEQVLDAVVSVSLADFFNGLQTSLGAAPDFARRWPKIDPRKAHLSAPDERHTIETLPEDPDRECVARVQSGDLNAFEELMNRHSRRTYRTLIAILGNPDDANDAMQDTFLKAFQYLAGFEHRSKFSTWLMAIATNTGIQRLRERKPLESLNENDADDEGFRPKQVQAWEDDPEQLYSHAEMRSLIENGVMKLPVKYRVVLMLRDIEQIPIEAAASALGLGIPAIKARLLRGRLMLRESLALHFVSSEGKGGAKGVTT